MKPDNLLCGAAEGLVKPDIVFFGESLPARFFQHLKQDFPQADLLIVLGTSLTVQPFASLIGMLQCHLVMLTTLRLLAEHA